MPDPSKPCWRAVSGEACPQGWWPAALFCPFGHHTLYVYDGFASSETRHPATSSAEAVSSLHTFLSWKEKEKNSIKTNFQTAVNKEELHQSLFHGMKQNTKVKFFSKQARLGRECSSKHFSFHEKTWEPMPKKQ
jgi:hypothetical protein